MTRLPVRFVNGWLETDEGNVNLLRPRISRSQTCAVYSIMPRAPLEGLIIIALLLLLSPAAADDVTDANRYWPQWRGPLGTGVAPHANPPVKWSGTKNIRWKIKLPGHGHSSPVVWADRIFVTTAIPSGKAIAPRYSGAPGAHDNQPVTHHHSFVALAVNRHDGDILWQRTVRKELPHEGGHNSASLASNSPVTDGELLFAFFGSRGLYCLDVDGELRWEKDYGRMRTKHGHGEGSSPVLYDDTLIVNWDHEGKSFLLALDKRTGDQRWKAERDEPTSWATPIVVEHEGRPQAIVSGTTRIRAYDLATGKVIWSCGGLSANIVASPVASGGMLYAGSSYDTRAMLAIRLDGARGNITETEHVVWRRIRGAPYVPSPLLYGGVLYYLAHYQNVLTRVIAKTGKDHPGGMRLGGIRNIYASPVAAAGRIYITDLDGTTLVISHAGNPKQFAMNKLDDRFSASAAIVGRDLILRGEDFLYCIGED